MFTESTESIDKFSRGMEADAKREGLKMSHTSPYWGTFYFGDKEVEISIDKNNYILKKGSLTKSEKQKIEYFLGAKIKNDINESQIHLSEPDYTTTKDSNILQQMLNRSTVIPSNLQDEIEMIPNTSNVAGKFPLKEGDIVNFNYKNKPYAAQIQSNYVIVRKRR